MVVTFSKEGQGSAQEPEPRNAEVRGSRIDAHSLEPPDFMPMRKFNKSVRLPEVCTSSDTVSPEHPMQSTSSLEKTRDAARHAALDVNVDRAKQSTPALLSERHRGQELPEAPTGPMPEHMQRSSSLEKTRNAARYAVLDEVELGKPCTTPAVPSERRRERQSVRFKNKMATPDTTKVSVRADEHRSRRREEARAQQDDSGETSVAALAGAFQMERSLLAPLSTSKSVPDRNQDTVSLSLARYSTGDLLGALSAGRGSIEGRALAEVLDDLRQPRRALPDVSERKSAPTSLWQELARSKMAMVPGGGASPARSPPPVVHLGPTTGQRALRHPRGL